MSTKQVKVGQSTKKKERVIKGWALIKAGTIYVHRTKTEAHKVWNEDIWPELKRVSIHIEN